MTTVELNAFRNELAREILSLDNLEVLKSVRRTINRAIKTHSDKAPAKEDLTPYTLSEIHAWIDEGEAEEKAGLTFTRIEADRKLKEELPWLK